jgi:hypothetical protein
MAYAVGSKPTGLYGPCGFDSRLRHQRRPLLVGRRPICYAHVLVARTSDIVWTVVLVVPGSLGLAAAVFGPSLVLGQPAERVEQD